MNTLVVPTDFSAAAERATAYAVQLAKKMAASVVLLHVYQPPVPMTDYPVLLAPDDDYKKVSDEGLERTVEEARIKYADVTFEAVSRFGDVLTEIEDVCRERNAVAVVVGSKDLSSFERVLFGDTTVSLLKKCSFPVIAVPEGTTAGLPANLVLATDLLNLDQIPVQQIAALTNQLGATLHVVHVEVEVENDLSPDPLMKALVGTNASYHSIKEDDVAEGLKHYVEQKGIDLVLVVPHKHNLYERLFFKGHTEGILHAVPVPVMSLRNS